MPIQVMIVDDSAVMRQFMQEALDKHADIHVLGTAPDPLFALQKMQGNWPDVILLDVEMPRMDGITFLRKVMSIRPTPVVICSTLTSKGADVTLQALEAGAFTIIEKPKAGLRDFIVDSSEDIVTAIREASHARMDRMQPMLKKSGQCAVTTSVASSRHDVGNASVVRPKLSADEILAAPTGHLNIPMTERIVVIGSSTGGTQALELVLTQLPRTSLGVAVVQHMPPAFTRSFAQRLDGLSMVEVKEAETGDRLIPGRVLIAPGGKHLLVKRSGAQYYAEVMDGPMVSRHKPSVDVLFRSAAKSAGQNAIGIIMTGMGDDGSRGMKEMHDAGAYTVAQDEASCVVFGMPKEAIRCGGVDDIVSLQDIPSVINKPRPLRQGMQHA